MGDQGISGLRLPFLPVVAQVGAPPCPPAQPLERVGMAVGQEELGNYTFFPPSRLSPRGTFSLLGNSLFVVILCGHSSYSQPWFLKPKNMHYYLNRAKMLSERNLYLVNSIF